MITAVSQRISGYACSTAMLFRDADPLDARFRPEEVIAVEAHPGLVALHKAVQGGWVPPEHVSEEEYQTARRGDPSDPRVTFIGFGCAFGGKWWGGYARNKAGGNYAQRASKSLQARRRSNVEHEHGDALAGPREAEVVYCDPPYDGTTGYTAIGTVDTDAFWHHLAGLASPTCACYLSEYAETPPAGIEARLVWTAPAHAGQLTKENPRAERLWRVLGYTAANGPAVAVDARVHDCKCERPSDFAGDMDQPNCPLHALNSTHGEDAEE